jgi:hypothetical protein
MVSIMSELKKEIDKNTKRDKRKALSESILEEVRIWVLPSEVNEIKARDRKKEVWNKSPGRKKRE